MVLPGQFLERPTLIAVGSQVLEGLSHRGTRRPPLLIVPTRPEEGSGMDHVVAAEVAWAAAMAGFPTLRFNHRGVGASQGTRPGTAQQLEDVAAALDLLRANADTELIAVLAIGGGAFNALELSSSDARICALALISPTGLDLERVGGCRLPLLVVTGQRDEREPRAALSRAVTRAGGVLEVVSEADQTFRRNLPEVGKAVVGWLRRISGER